MCQSRLVGDTDDAAAATRPGHLAWISSSSATFSEQQRAVRSRAHGHVDARYAVLARKAAAMAMGAPENVEFIPVGPIEGPASAGPAMPAPPDPEPAQQPEAVECKSGSIEIVLPNGARVSVDAFVNEKALSRVLRAVKGVA